MACEFTCDGCGKKQLGFYMNHHWFKPSSWFERDDEDGVQTVCSRECIKRVAERTRKTDIVLPI